MSEKEPPYSNWEQRKRISRNHFAPGTGKTAHMQELFDRISKQEQEYRDRVGPVDLFSGKGSFRIASGRPSESVDRQDKFVYGEAEVLGRVRMEAKAQIETREETNEADKFLEETIDSLRQNLPRIAKAYQELGEEPEQPPKSAEYLAYLFFPKAQREAQLGDLVEEYPLVVAKFGVRRAKFNFYLHVLFSIFLLLRNGVVKWALFGWVGAWIRKISS